VRQALKAAIVKALGVILTILGLILFALPLPLGIPLTAIGLVMLISTSKTARRAVRYLRMRFGPIDKVFSVVETNVPGPTQRILRKTRRRIVGRRRHETPAE
jgi:hypothetical protein